MGQTASSPSSRLHNQQHFHDDSLESIQLALDNILPSNNNFQQQQQQQQQQQPQRRPPSPTNPNSNAQISPPRNVEQPMHIEFDAITGAFHGVPIQWKHAFDNINSNPSSPLTRPGQNYNNKFIGGGGGPGQMHSSISRELDSRTLPPRTRFVSNNQPSSTLPRAIPPNSTSTSSTSPTTKSPPKPTTAKPIISRAKNRAKQLPSISTAQGSGGGGGGPTMLTNSSTIDLLSTSSPISLSRSSPSMVTNIESANTTSTTKSKSKFYSLARGPPKTPSPTTKQSYFSSSSSSSSPSPRKQSNLLPSSSLPESLVLNDRSNTSAIKPVAFGSATSIGYLNGKKSPRIGSALSPRIRSLPRTRNAAANNNNNNNQLTSEDYDHQPLPSIPQTAYTSVTRPPPRKQSGMPKSKSSSSLPSSTNTSTSSIHSGSSEIAIPPERRIPNIRPRRISNVRRSRVMSIAPHGSLLSSTSLVAALAAVELDDDSTAAELIASIDAHRRNSLDYAHSTRDSIASSLRPRSSSSISESPSSAYFPTARPISTTSISSSVSDDRSSTHSSILMASVQIHPAVQQFINEARRLEKINQAQLKLANASSKMTNPHSGMQQKKSADSLVQLLKEGALGETGREIAELTAMEVNPSNLALALTGLVEQGVDPYTIYSEVKAVAEGCSGDVHFAMDGVIQSKVAIKIIPRDNERSADKIKRLPLEVHFMRSSRHDSIVAFIGAYLTPMDVWVVTEWMDGGSLADLLYTDDDDDDQDVINSNLTTNAIAYITYHLASALKYLHTNHKIHRDVRSDNVLLSSTGQVKITDFGYANEIHAPLVEPVGTPYWLAPEVALAAARALNHDQLPPSDLALLLEQQQLTYGTEVDMWALGVTMYEMASKTFPYAEFDEVHALLQIAKFGVQELSLDAMDILSDDGVHLWTLLTTLSPSDRVSASNVLMHPFVTGADLRLGRLQLVSVIESSAAAALMN